MDFLCKISRHPSDCDTQERTANNSFMFKDNTPSIRSMRLMQSRVKTSPAGPLAPPTACRQSARPQAHQRPLLTVRCGASKLSQLKALLNSHFKAEGPRFKVNQCSGYKSTIVQWLFHAIGSSFGKLSDTKGRE